jgi:hypothetical protein
MPFEGFFLRERGREREREREDDGSWMCACP